MLRKNFLALKQKFALGSLTTFLMLGITHSVMAEPAQVPLFLTAPVKPLMMLNMSKDHQLYFKAYDDYTDLDPEADDGIETTYKHSYDYYGYFDSKKCYKYQNSQFEPITAVSEEGLCNVVGTNQWSGNFLNWATMTRMDAVRKILYGGMRSTDGATETVLERAFLPHDAHSFAKFYNGPIAISSLTPFNPPQGLVNTQATGITICNTTKGSGFSQNVTSAPLIRVAKGNYSLWASNERWQCKWDEDVSGANGKNGNDPAKTGLYASASSPKLADAALAVGDVKGDFNARVKVCVAGMLEDNCRIYPSGNTKPAGLLQHYGEPNDINFGLITGSYSKNKSGGVLRKNIGGMADEINIATDGSFKTAPTTGGVISTLNRLRIFGYNYSNGEYSDSSDNGDNCSFGLSSFNDGRCTNWGNPQAEIFLESLRYFAGKENHEAFEATDSGKISGLITAEWNDPLSTQNYCAPLSVIQFNASTISYDSNFDTAQADLPGLNAVNETNEIGILEELTDRYFVGENGVAGESDQLCTAKAVSNLADVRGTCPDAPRLEGSYLLAGLAKYARSNDIRTNLTGDQKVQTYGVAMSPAVPAVTVPVPGSNGAKRISILPACQNAGEDASSNPIKEGNCAIVDFKIIEYDHDSTTSNTGKLYVNWEAAEQGGDYDQDMWGLIEYTVTSATVSVKTQVMQQSSGRKLGFGYVISGTETDGFKVHSGIQNYTNGTSCTLVDGNRCTCRAGTNSGHAACDSPQAAARTQTYLVKSSDSNSQFLQSPLYYAAKWGGYSREFEKQAARDNVNINTKVKDRDPSDSYFYATDPRQLEASLKAAFAKVADSVGSASAVATNSTRLSNDSFLYQARFNSTSWSGELLAYPFDGNTNGFSVNSISTNETLRSDRVNSAERRVYTYDGTGLIEFKWEALSTAQKAYLMDDDIESLGRSRVDWLRGAKVTGLREREKSGNNEFLLGDIVNSSPAYLGGTDMRYSQLPGAAGSSYRSYLQNTKRGLEKFARVFVGANDGMLHAFDAATLEEKFAYVPAGVYPKLAAITKPSYGMGGENNPHQYLVDGPVAVGDAYLNGEWKSIVVGTLGAGGKGIFALDVTDPDAAPKVLFELNNIQHLGYVMRQPYIVPLKDGEGIRWAVVFGNGYEAGSSTLFWVDLESYEVNTIVAPEGQGLSAPALLPNGVGIVEAAYAGDLNGNMWKFHLSSTDGDDGEVWRATLLFSAKTSGANPVAQPITATPTLGRNALRNNNVMVYFGTGQYIYHGDNTSNIPSQSFYAIVDKSAEISGKEALHKKEIVAREGGGRDINFNSVNWLNNIDGWYVDLPTLGERVTTKPLLLNDKVIFTTLIPSVVPCEYGGSSWIMEVPAVGDKYVGESILDDNIYQGFLTLNDINFALIPEAPPADNDEEDPDQAEPPQQCGEGEYPGKIFVPGSAGKVTSEDACLSKGSLGRMSWRQLR